MGRRIRAYALLYVVVLLALLAAGDRLPGGGRLRDAAAVLLLPAGLLRIPLHQLGVGRPPWLPYAEVVVLGVVNAVLAYLLVRLLRRDPSAAGVERRLGFALTAPGVRVTPMAYGRRGPRCSRTGLLRTEHSLLLRDVPIPFPELTGVYREHWQRAGLRTEDLPEPPGGVCAWDHEGYEYRLGPGPGPAYLGEAVLRVGSPPRARGPFWAGLAAGLAAGLLLPPPAGPVLLVTGVVLQAHGRTRSFATGVLIGCLPGVVIALRHHAVPPW